MGGLTRLEALAQTAKSLLGRGLSAALGLVSGVSTVVKFGHCTNAGSVKTDVWELGATQPVYIFPDMAGEDITISSSNAADNQVIAIECLDVNGFNVTKSITLDGLNVVPIAGSVIAVNRAFNDDSTPTLGDITIKGAVSGNTFAYIDALEQQTTQCIYMSPAGKNVAVMNVSSSMNTGGNQDSAAVVVFAAQENGGVFRTQVRYGLQQRGTSNLSSDLIIPSVYPPMTRLKISITPDTSPADISAEFSMKLIDI